MNESIKLPPPKKRDVGAEIAVRQTYTEKIIALFIARAAGMDLRAGARAGRRFSGVAHTGQRGTHANRSRVRSRAVRPD